MNISAYTSLWRSSDCDQFNSNSTIAELWPSTVSKMANTASLFFSLGNFSEESKLDYLFNLTSAELFSPEIFSLVPWVGSLLLLVMVFLAVVLFLFHCQVFCVKKYRLFARCCMIDLNSNSGSNTEKCCLFCCLFLSISLTVLIMVLMFLNNDIFMGWNEGQCFLYNLAIEIDVPYPTDSLWLGALPLSQKLNNASSLMLQLSKESTSSQNTNDVSLQTSDMFAQFNQLEQEFEANLTVYDNMTLSNPNPLSTGNISSTFLSSWGPSYVSGTYLYQLKEELETRLQYLKLLDYAFNISTALVNSSQNYSSILASKTENFSEFDQLFDEGFTQFAGIFDKNDKDMQALFVAIIAIMASNLFPMLLGLLGFIMVAFCRWKVCNCCLHCAWILSCLLVILMLMILAFGFFYSSLFVWSCDVYDMALTDESFYQKVQEKVGLNTSLANATEFCFFNDSSDLSVYYGFNDILYETDSFYLALSNLSSMTLSTQLLDADITKLTDYYTNYEFLAGKYGPDNEDHPIAALEKLNLWSNYDSVGSYQQLYGDCEVSADEYVFNDAQCLYEEVYTSSDSADYMLGQTLCISYNETTFDFAQKRYQHSSFNNCSNNITSFSTVDNAIRSYYEHIYLYKEAAQTLIEEMLQSLKYYRSDLLALDNNITLIYNATKGIFTKFEGLFEVLSKKESGGLTFGLNCSFLRQGMQKIGNSVCITTMDGVFYLYITLFAVFFFQILISVASCLSSIRMLPREFDSDGQVLIEKNPEGVELRRHSILY